MDFYTLFPSLEPFVQNLTGLWPASMIRQSPWMFAFVEATHLLSLAVLGGAVLLLNLRLVGVGLTSETPASLEKSLRPFLWGAIAGLVLSGIAMAMVIAEKLFTSGAYFVKMLTLIAALLFSFGVTTPIARSGGAPGLPARILGALSLAIWLFAIYIFGKSQGMNPGTFHVVFAGFLIAMIFGSKRTRMVLGGLTGAAVIVATLAYEVVRPSPDAAPSPALARMAGIVGILLWVTVAAAGRWIGLG